MVSPRLRFRSRRIGVVFLDFRYNLDRALIAHDPIQRGKQLIDCKIVPRRRTVSGDPGGREFQPKRSFLRHADVVDTSTAIVANANTAAFIKHQPDILE